MTEHLDKMGERLETINIIIRGIYAKAKAEDRKPTDRERSEIETLNEEYSRIKRMRDVLIGLGI